MDPRSRKPAICAILTVLSGQYNKGVTEHPPVIPAMNSCSIYPDLALAFTAASSKNSKRDYLIYCT